MLDQAPFLPIWPLTPDQLILRDTANESRGLTGTQKLNKISALLYRLFKSAEDEGQAELSQGLPALSSAYARYLSRTLSLTARLEEEEGKKKPLY